ncbi:site-specific integrase [Ferrovum sp.]|uniref:site-specific integrase n=1 Tax=Ferrovum sp. TaxID=2609467 RepID=UPI00262B22B8|nr:site-specific integrase [Ferrovum sp.]
MATCRKRGDKWEFVVKCKRVRDKPFYFSFNTKEEGDAYCKRLETVLSAGIFPPELSVTSSLPNDRLCDVIKEYIKARSITDDDVGYLSILIRRMGDTKTVSIDYSWVENWIRDMKIKNNLAPATIRHYVGALARCLDWGKNKGAFGIQVNPLRLLPVGYSTYNSFDQRLLTGCKKVKKDIERDRRLEDGEEDAIRETLARVKYAAGIRFLDMRWRGALECMFDLALETAMRMRETYTLTLDQIDFRQRTIFLDKTKNGDKRQVPMTTVAIRAIRDYMRWVNEGSHEMQGFSLTNGILFPWWSGADDRRELRAISAKLSQHFARVFEVAGCPDLHYHDLRHEATSRIFERTKLSDGSIMKITGHKGVRMLLRYANIRGSSLADQLW